MPPSAAAVASRRWGVSLRDYVLPILGANRVNAIGTADVMRVLLPIWPTGARPPPVSGNASAPSASGRSPRAPGGGCRSASARSQRRSAFALGFQAERCDAGADRVVRRGLAARDVVVRARQGLADHADAAREPEGTGLRTCGPGSGRPGNRPPAGTTPPARRFRRTASVAEGANCTKRSTNDDWTTLAVDAARSATYDPVRLDSRAANAPR